MCINTITKKKNNENSGTDRRENICLNPGAGANLRGKSLQCEALPRTRRNIAGSPFFPPTHQVSNSLECFSGEKDAQQWVLPFDESQARMMG